MRIDIFDQTVELATNRSIVLHDARAAEIVCTRGRLWITEDPLRNDLVLEAGQSHVIQVDGMAFVTAIYPSAVWLREPARIHVPQPSPALLSGPSGVARRLLRRIFGSGVGNQAVA